MGCNHHRIKRITPTHMNTLQQARRQRAFQRREESILSSARQILLTHGYHGLTMHRIAQAISYSRGTIYQHFHCKEEIVSALARQTMEDELALECRAAQYPGRPRERMVAMGEAVRLYTLLHLDKVQMLQIIQTQAIREKASDAILEKLTVLEFNSQRLMIDIVHDGLACGDLALPPKTSAEEITFALWSIVVGGNLTVVRNRPLSHLSINDPFETVMKACDVLGDGYHWRPLSTEWDYGATREDVRRRIFPKETQALADIHPFPFWSDGEPMMEQRVSDTID